MDLGACFTRRRKEATPKYFGANNCWTSRPLSRTAFDGMELSCRPCCEPLRELCVPNELPQTRLCAREHSLCPRGTAKRLFHCGRVLIGIGAEEPYFPILWRQDVILRTT